MVKVKYVSGSKLFSAFGEADFKNKIIYVRRNLPKPVKKFVKEHEIYHLKHDSKNLFWGEIKASLYGALKHPIGFLMCLIMGLSVRRLRFYFKRFREGR